MRQYLTNLDPEDEKRAQAAATNKSFVNRHRSNQYPKTWCAQCGHFFGSEPSWGSHADRPAHFYDLPRHERKAILVKLETPEYKLFHNSVELHMIDKHHFKKCDQCGVLVKNIKTHQKSIACLCTAKQRQMEDQGYMQVGHMMAVFEELLQDDLQARLSKVGDVVEFDRINEEFEAEKKELVKSLAIQNVVSDYSKAQNSFGNTLGWQWRPWVPLDIGEGLLFLYKHIKKSNDRKKLPGYLQELRNFTKADDAGKQAILGLWELAEMVP